MLKERFVPVLYWDECKKEFREEGLTCATYEWALDMLEAMLNTYGGHDMYGVVEKRYFRE